jgi:tetratricopeptide (TPR) repeat protein
MTFFEIGISDVYYRLGRLYFRKLEPIDLTASLKALNSAISENQFTHETHRTEAYFQRAEVLVQTGLSQQAIADYRSVIDLSPDHYSAHIRLATLLWENKQDALQAEALYSEALDIDNQNQAAYLGLARIYRDTDRIPQAIEMYRQVLLFNPEATYARKQLKKLSATLDK